MNMFVRRYRRLRFSGRAVKIYLLLIDHERFFFYADESEPFSDLEEDADSSALPPSGLRGWIHVQLLKFKAAWEHPETGAMRWMRRAWDWLHTWAHPDEAMLSRLWKVRTIALNHPSTRSVEEVRSLWEVYLDQQWWRHLAWMCFNGSIAPFAIATLWILPGPNLIGYWFLYRAIHHSLVVWGIGRVRRGLISIELHAMPALDLPIERDGNGRATHAALDGAGALLDEHVAWHHSARPKKGRGPALGKDTTDPR